MVLNQKCGTKCASCETEQPGNEIKLDVSVDADASEALAYSSFFILFRLCDSDRNHFHNRGGIMVRIYILYLNFPTSTSSMLLILLFDSRF